MKKLISILLSAALACLCAGALAEDHDYGVPRDVIDAFSDTWVCENENISAAVEIWFDLGETVAEGNLAIDDDRDYRWRYDSCAYDAQTGSLVFTNGERTMTHLDEAGEDLVVEPQASSLTAAFVLDDAGKLRWQDDEGLLDGVVFLRLEDAVNQVTESPDPGALAFEGAWACGRATIDISAEDEGFKCSISWADSAAVVYQWEYACLYDAQTHTLVDSGMGALSVVTYAEDGSIASSEEQYADGRAVFAIDEDGFLTWKDEIEDRGADMTFEKVERVDFSDEDDADDAPVDGFGGFDGGEDVNCFVDEQGHYVIQIAVASEDEGLWVADEAAGDDGVVTLYYGDTLEDTFVANYEGHGDGEATVTARHMVEGVCDEVYTWELAVADSRITECIAGSWATSPEDAELDGAISGAWTGDDGTAMTVALSADGGWDAALSGAEGDSSLRLRYDCDLDAFVYADEAGKSGFFALQADGSLRWGDADVRFTRG